MGLIIDSSVFIAHERGQADLDLDSRGSPDEPIAMSIVTVSELLHGVHRANTKSRRDKRQAFVDHLISNIPIVEFDLDSAYVYAKLWAELAKKGIGIAAHDLMIGAQACSLGFKVLTVNQKDFERIPGLEVQTILARP